MHRQKVLIVGGGFGGIKAALSLANDERFDVTLLSDRPDFRYYPSLYHTATGGLPSQSSIQLADIFENKKILIAIGQATKLDRDTKTVKTSDHRTFGYDILILALGVVTNYFGIKGLQEFSYGIKSVEDAENLKYHLHDQLTAEHKPDLNYIIVGGGPTGIELAGALTAYLHQIMRNHGLVGRKIHIDLVEAAPHLLPRMPKAVGRHVERQLRKLGVKLYLSQTVGGESVDKLMVNNVPIESHTVVWTAGVTNHPFFKANNFPLNAHSKVIVDGYLQADDGIFVIGDNASTPYSGMAQTAIYDGEFVARILRRHASGKDSRAYKPRKPIYVIPAGPHWAAVLWGRKQFYGRIGWWLRELADALAFKDLEPWGKAGRQWMKEFTAQEDCPQCARFIES